MKMFKCKKCGSEYIEETMHGQLLDIYKEDEVIVRRYERGQLLDDSDLAAYQHQCRACKERLSVQNLLDLIEDENKGDENERK